MGYGIGTDHVDVSVQIVGDTKLPRFLDDVRSAIGSLVKAGCRELRVSIHEHGAVVTGNRAVRPLPLEDADNVRSMREILRR